MADYLAMAAKAQRMIANFGEKVTLRTFPKPAVNVDQPWRPTAPAPADQLLVPCIFLPQKLQKDAPLRYADGTSQRIGDMEVLVGPALTTPPDIGSELIRGDGSRWVVKHVSTLAPAGTPLLHTLWASQ